MKLENKHGYRYEMVQLALRIGIKPTAREYKANPKTVRKWVNRYQKLGLKGLKDQSRKPKHSPNKCSERFEKKVIKLRTQTANKFGTKRLIERFSLQYGESCVRRIIRENKLTRKKKTKRSKRNELWSVKKLTKAFEKIQIDVKILTDIPLYWRQYLKQDLPKYEFTARDVKTGATFICYATKNDSINAGVFAAYLLDHLKAFGFDLTHIEIQTDNGAEFNATGRLHRKNTPFETIVKDCFKVRLGHIPPASPTFNSDVETAHRLVEDEFYDIEFIDNKQDLLEKMNTWLIDFNYLRKNSYKDCKTPFDLLQEDFPNSNKAVLHLPPIFLNDHTHLYLEQIARLNPKPNTSPESAPVMDKQLLHTLARWDPFGVHDVSPLHKLFIRKVKLGFAAFR